jgi:hypothetical protein
MQPHQHPDPKRLKNVQFQGWGAYILTFTAGVAYWVILNPHSKWLPYFTQILKMGSTQSHHNLKLPKTKEPQNPILVSNETYKESQGF